MTQLLRLRPACAFAAWASAGCVQEYRNSITDVRSYARSWSAYAEHDRAACLRYIHATRNEEGERSDPSPHSA